jgi:hypothetical protein
MIGSVHNSKAGKDLENHGTAGGCTLNVTGVASKIRAEMLN